MKKTSPPLRRQKQTKDEYSFESSNLPEDWIMTRNYTDEDILVLTRLIKEKLTFKGLDPFRRQCGEAHHRNLILAAILVQHYSRHIVRNTAPVQYKTHDPYLLAILNDVPARRAYKTVKPESFIHRRYLENEYLIPFEKAYPEVIVEFAGLQMVMGDILKQAFIHWDLFSIGLHQNDANFRTIHTRLRQLVSAYYQYVTEEILRNNMKDEIDNKDFASFLSQDNEFLNPDIFYQIESIIIDFISELTYHGYPEKARIIHQLLMSIKSLVYLFSSDPKNREDIFIYLAPSFITGLKLGEKVQRVDYSFYPKLFSLTLKNKLFSFDYDQNAYLLLYNLKKLFTDQGQANIPDLVLRDGSSPVRETLKDRYMRLAQQCTEQDSASLDVKIYTYFASLVGSYAKYYGLDKAEQAHNVLHALYKMHLEDVSPSKDQTFGLVIRQLFDLPMTHTDFDKRFDSLSARVVLDSFTAPFKKDAYIISISQEEFSESYQTSQSTINALIFLNEQKDQTIAQLVNDLALKKETNKQGKLKIATLTAKVEALTLAASSKQHRSLHFMHRGDKSTPSPSSSPPKLAPETRSFSEHDFRIGPLPKPNG